MNGNTDTDKGNKSKEHETKIKRVSYANSDQQGKLNKDSEVESGRATIRKQKHFISEILGTSINQSAKLGKKPSVQKRANKQGLPSGTVYHEP